MKEGHCSNMDGPRGCHIGWSKSDRGEILCDMPYMWNLKRNDTNELTKQKETHRLRKGMIARGKGYSRSLGLINYCI